MPPKKAAAPAKPSLNKSSTGLPPPKRYSKAEESSDEDAKFSDSDQDDSDYEDFTQDSDCEFTQCPVCHTEIVLASRPPPAAVLPQPSPAELLAQLRTAPSDGRA